MKTVRCQKNSSPKKLSQEKIWRRKDTRSLQYEGFDGLFMESEFKNERRKVIGGGFAGRQGDTLLKNKLHWRDDWIFNVIGGDRERQTTGQVCGPVPVEPLSGTPDESAQPWHVGDTSHKNVKPRWLSVANGREDHFDAD